MAELVDALDLESSGATRGVRPPSPTSSRIRGHSCNTI